MFSGKKLDHFLCGLGVSLLVTAATANQPSPAANREWIKTAVQDQLNRGDLNKAAEILRDHLKQDSLDSDSWAKLAFIQSRTARCEEAQSSLIRAAKVGSASVQSIYLQAAETLKTKGCQNISAEMLNAPKEESKSSEWSGYAGLRFGHDSNVMLLPDQNVSENGSSSQFVNPTAQVNYDRQFGSGTLNVNSITSYTSYLNSTVTDYNSLFESLGLEWRPTKAVNSIWTQSYANRIDISWVNSDGLKYFSGSNTVSGSFSRAVGDNKRLGFDLPVSINRYSAETASTSDERRDGQSLAPSAWYSKQFENLTWTNAVTWNKAWAMGTNYNSQGVSLLTGASGDIDSQTRYRASISYTDTDYNTHLENRYDRRWDASVNLVYTMVNRPNWSFGGEYLYSSNRSNLNNLSYNRSSVTGQVNYAF